MDNYEIHSLKEKAKNLFLVKPFFVQFKKLHDFTSIVIHVFSMFSIVTGFGFMYYLLSELMPAYIAALFSCMILLIIEVVKRLTIKEWVVAIYNRVAILYGLFVAVIIFTAISVYMSVNGASEWFLQKTTAIQSFQNAEKAQMDSIDNYYNNLKKQADSTHYAFINSVTYKGKVDVSNKAVKESVLTYNNTVREIYTEYSKIVDNLRKNNEIELSRIKARNFTYYYAIMYISAINELCIIACIWFNIYYMYRVNIEVMREAYYNTSHSNKGADVNTALLEDLRNGETRFNILASKHKVNAKTIHLHKQLI